MDELLWAGVEGQASALAAGDVSAVDLLDAVLRRIDEVDPALNAFTLVMAEEARREAATRDRAREAGEPVVVHDSPLLLEKHHDAGDRYAAVVAVIARREDRIDRVVRDRGRDRGYAESVMAAQVSDLERIRRADRLVLNTGDEQVLRERALHALEAVLTELGIPLPR